MLINPTTYATTGTTGTGTTGTGTTATGTTSTGTTGTGNTGSASTSTGINGAATLDGTNFITLMLAQLQNQDPTNPVDSNTFLSQLAELSEVQGINTLNTNFSTLASSITGSQALQASSLLGHQVLVSSSTATTSAAGSAVTGAVSVPQSTADVTLNITNSAGVLVKTLDLGASSGNTSFSWDGTENNGSKAPADTYTLTATYAGAASGSTAATTYVNGTVESVSIGSSSSSTSAGSSSSSSSSSSGTTSSGMTLNVSGVGSVPFANVLQINN